MTRDRKPRRATGGIVSVGAPLVPGEHGCSLTVGGPVEPSGYWAGEHGPELIVPFEITVPSRPLSDQDGHGDGVVRAHAERLDQPLELPPGSETQE